MKTTIRLGGTVRGLYCNVAFEGTLCAIDGSGFHHVALTKPIVVAGSRRDRICLAPAFLSTLKLVQASHVDEDRIGMLPQDMLGGLYLKTA